MQLCQTNALHSGTLSPTIAVVGFLVTMTLNIAGKCPLCRHAVHSCCPLTGITTNINNINKQFGSRITKIVLQ